MKKYGLLLAALLVGAGITAVGIGTVETSVVSPAHAAEDNPVANVHYIGHLKKLHFYGHNVEVWDDMDEGTRCYIGYNRMSCVKKNPPK